MSIASAVAAGRREIERHLLTDTCEIQTPASTSDSAGGSNDPTWSTVSTVSCQVSDLTARSAEIASKLAEVVDKEITIPAATTIAATQRIKHTQGATVTYYKVVGVNDRSIELARSVFAQVVRPAP